MSAAAAGSGASRLRVAALVGLALAAYHGLALWDPRVQAHPAVVGWLFESSESSPQVVFAIVAALLFQRRKELLAAPLGTPSPVRAAFSLGLGVAFHVWAQWVDAPDQMIPSLALTAFGTAFAYGGTTLARRLAPPLALLVFALPIPGALNNLVVFPMQLASARFAHFGLRVLGFDAVLQADMIGIRGETFEVIETCSGLRSLQTLLLLAAAWAVYFRCSARHALGLILTAPVIAFVTNGIRVMILVVDTRPEVRESHVTQGVVMFLVGTLLLSLVDRGLLRVEGARPTAPAVAPPAPAASAVASARRIPVSVTLALLVMAVAALAQPGPRVPPPAPIPTLVLPLALPGFEVSEARVPGHFLGSVRFQRRQHLAYRRPGEAQPVRVFLGWEDRQARLQSLVSRKNDVPGSGWTVEERGPVQVGAFTMERVLAVRFARRSLSLRFYAGSGGAFYESLRSALALDLPNSPFARPDWAGVLRLSVNVEPGAGGIEAAERRLREVFSALSTPPDAG